MSLIRKMAGKFLPKWALEELTMAYQDKWMEGGGNSDDEDTFIDFVEASTTKEAPIEGANLLTSKVKEVTGVRKTLQELLMQDPTPEPEGGWHYPIFDLDVPHVYVPSTTKGHGHLIIQKKMSLESMLALYAELVDHGLMGPGFAEATRIRGFASIRLPWIKKGDENIVDTAA